MAKIENTADITLFINRELKLGIFQFSIYGEVLAFETTHNKICAH